jgi:hypothetical protein
MKVSGQLHAPAVVEKKENYLLLLGIEPQFFGGPPRRYPV